MTAIKNKVESLLKRCLGALYDVHLRADLPYYFGPYGAGAWWSR
jgi:hypothetical protein